MLSENVGQTRRRHPQRQKRFDRCQRCRHDKCTACERNSLPPRTSPFWICHKCRDLNRRRAAT